MTPSRPFGIFGKRRAAASPLSFAMLAALVLLPTVSAHAEPTSADEAASRALFAEGRALIAEGRIAEACPKFEEGNRLSPGVGLKFNLADCFEKLGKRASAWAAFLDAASGAKSLGQVDREKVARQRASALEPQLAKFRIDVPESAKLLDLEITRDGSVVGVAQWGLALPIDPGTHVVVARAKGRVTWTYEADVRDVPALVTVAIPTLDLAHPTPNRDVARVKAAAPPESERAPRGQVQRALGLSIGAAGVIALGVGGVYGALAIQKKNASSAHCGSSNGADARDRCDAEGLALRDSAFQRANVATAMFIAGGALVAGGAALYFTAPHSRVTMSARGPALFVEGVLP